MGQRGNARVTASCAGTHDRDRETPAEGKQSTSAIDDAVAGRTRRRAERRTDSNPGPESSKGKVLKPKDCPQPNKSYLRLLEAGKLGGDGERFASLDTMNDRSRLAAVEWWAKYAKQDRIIGWFRGAASTDSCVAMLKSKGKASSEWEDGDSHACVACRRAERSCIRLKLTEEVHLAVVLPEAGKEGEERSQYWVDV